MRKLKPASVGRTFSKSLDSLQDLLIAGSQGSGERFRQQLSELVLLSGMVMWDSFVADLFVAYVNRDSTKYREYLRLEVQKFVGGKFGTATATAVTLDLTKHIPRKKVRDLLDAEGEVPMLTSKLLKKRAVERLTPAFAAPFSLTSKDAAILDALRALRNYVAHKSPKSREAMNNALFSPALPAALRRGTRKLSKLGSWLVARPTPKAEPRIVQLLNELRRLAETLCPPGTVSVAPAQVAQPTQVTQTAKAA